MCVGVVGCLTFLDGFSAINSVSFDDLTWIGVIIVEDAFCEVASPQVSVTVRMNVRSALVTPHTLHLNENVKIP